jgi:hypothetical protein
MEITDFKDFYIDLNGDVKASISDNSVARFLTTTDKPNSQYFVADNFNELQERVHEVNAMFDLSDKNLLKQYSVKTDVNGNVIGIKLYGDHDSNQDGFDYILIGYDITSLGYETDFYFMASVGDVNNFIKKKSLVYEIKQFETHEPFLFSVKKNENGEITNFKTYYAIKENVILYTKGIVPNLKQTLKFS